MSRTRMPEFPLIKGVDDEKIVSRKMGNVSPFNDDVIILFTLYIEDERKYHMLESMITSRPDLFATRALLAMAED